MGRNSKEDDSDNLNLSDSSQDSDSGSDRGSSSSKSRSRDRDRKSKKDRKEKKSKKDKKTKKHKSEKSKKKKDKKSKKKKDKKKKEKKQKEFGYYGIISKEQFYDKKEEFIAWLQEVKGQSIETLKPYEEKDLFDDYCESYNTCSFPDIKYYDIQIWEKKYMHKKMKEEYNQAILDQQNVGNTGSFNDEDHMRQNRQNFAKNYESQAILTTLRKLQEDKNLANDIKQQKNEATLISQSFKAGDTKTTEELKKKREQRLGQTTGQSFQGGGGDDEYY